MRKFIIFFVFCWISLCAFAQSSGNNTSELQKIATLKSKGRVMLFKGENQVPAAEFFNKYYSYFGLASADMMVLKEESSSRDGIRNYRYQQQYMNVPIEGATLVLHEKNGVVTYANGQFISNFNRPFMPVFSADDAVALAILNTPAEQYSWQNEDLEKDLKETRQDPSATYAPQAKLMYYDPSHSSDCRNYRLAYEIEVFALNPLMTKVFYIDATNGDILKELKKNQNVNVEVQAKTRYNGVQTITVDSVSATQFILRELTRGEGNGIYTRSLHNQGSLYELPVNQAIDVEESDNFFDVDSVANAAHFGAERTYDYYYEKFGRNSIDNNGLRLMSYVHLGQSVENACWSNGGMFYGDGTNGREFTFMTVCGHEISHGLTENTANLIYEYEPGALNEAFSDIFGSMISYFATDTLKWTIGDELGEPFRDMSNPKAYQNPNTYQGQYWVSDASDNGGVHYNSGVANYWFYLLCQGGQGVNDNGTSYNVQGIGTAEAERIAFYTLTENLVETSDYEDTYELSLLVAADLYGECSPEVYSVAEAWRAVGVGYAFSDTTVYVEQVLSPVTGCALTEEEPIVLELSYNSCSQPLAAGTDLYFQIVVDQNLTLTDTITLEEDVQPGDFFQVELHRAVDASEMGQHHLKVFAKPYFADSYTDSIVDFTFDNLIYQNSDLHIAQLVSPVSSCFLTAETPIVCAITFDICDSIAAGDSVLVGYKINTSDTIAEWIVLDRTVTSSDTIIYTFNEPADMTQTARNTVRVYSLNPDDTDASDDAISQVVFNPTPLNEIDRVTFESTNMNQYYFTEVGDYATLSVSTLSGYNGGKLVKMSGGNAMSYYNDLEFPEGDWWAANERMNSSITFCADATDYAQFAIQFDVKQTSGADIYNQLLSGYLPDGVDLLQSSMLRVLVDGEQVGPNMTPATSSNDPFATRAVNLCDYIGGKHSITFQSKCLAGDLLMFTLDHVYLDNIAMLESDKINNYTNPAVHFITYPNPTTSTTILQIENLTEDAEYQIFDMSGRLLSQERISDNNVVIDLNRFANGIYLMKLVGENGLLGTSKIVKQ